MMTRNIFRTCMVVSLIMVATTALPTHILVDTDLNTDDLFALIYLLKLNRSEFDLKAVTINTNAWTHAGHAINHLYDIFFMMGRDDILVGVGGEGGISGNGTISHNVGGYLPIIDQGMTTAGYCGYRQAIPVGQGGQLDTDTNYGLRRSFLPQGKRRYIPIEQPTAQQVMYNVISKGPTTVFLMGAHTNFGLFLMKNPNLKKNVDHIYISGGGVRSKNPTGCCPRNGTTPCKPEQCGDHGNVFTDYTSNPYAEYNILGDPFAAYQVIHSGIPVTLVPLDATNMVPITEEFFAVFEANQNTYEAQYLFKSMKINRDTWSNDQFFTSYFMWDSFMVGVAVSIMRNPDNPSGENEFAEMEYMNITVRTSNKPYGVSDGSNPFFDGRTIPRFRLIKGGVHSGHVQRSVSDPFCLVKNKKGRCKDGYTEEVKGLEGTRILVATRAKPNKDPASLFDNEYFEHFLQVLNRPQQSGRFNFTRRFPRYKEVLYKPNIGAKTFGKPVIFDMDMSVGDFLALFYLLKVPTDVVNLRAIFVTPTGWADAATIDIVYDLLHMMGRDDIPVGLGDLFALNQTDPNFPEVGDCSYTKFIPQGSGGFLDSDTLYGLARDLPRSPRRYTGENSVKYGAPRNTQNPELRQPRALEVWENITRTLGHREKITILTNGPLTTLSNVLTSDKNAASKIQEVFVVGADVDYGSGQHQGNVFSNMFLDPLATKTVVTSEFNITLITWEVQRRFGSFPTILKSLSLVANKTPELIFVRRLISTLQTLKHKHHKYRHMEIFLGEILGAIVTSDGIPEKSSLQVKHTKVVVSSHGKIVIDENNGKPVKIVEDVVYLVNLYYELFSTRLGEKAQSAVIGSFSEQEKRWQ